MKYQRLYFITGSFSAALGLTGCAGPYTPIGAVWTWVPVSASMDADVITSRQRVVGSGPELYVTPSRQVLHGPSSIRVTVRDPVGDLKPNYFSVRFNGLDVSQSFLRQSRLSVDSKEKVLVIENPVVRLPATEDQVIEFAYRSPKSGKAVARFESPVCNAFIPQAVNGAGPFRISADMIPMITWVSSKEGFNPALFTGLIAQESRFNPFAVSWARAVGLTQVTSTAEAEILREKPEWPRYPGIESMNVHLLRAQILSHRINSRNEWRLDPLHSIEGGVIFARQLAERWSTPENEARIAKLFRDSEVGKTQLILASYHSGYARVHEALEIYGKNWLKSPDLGEARKYVNRIFSYCHSFVEETEKEKENASKTQGA